MAIRAALALRENKGLILTLALALALMGIATFSIERLQQDDYYHIKAAQMLRQDGISRQMPSMEYTVMNENYYDMYFFYHALLIPFTFGNLIIGAKASALFFAALTIIVFYKFLEHYQIRYPWLWTLSLVFGSSFYFTRIIATRPIFLSITLFAAALHLLFKKEYKMLFWLSFLFAYMYSGFIFLIAVVAVHAVCYLFYYRKIEHQPLMYTILGIAAGLAVNPYFPNSLSVLWAQYGKIFMAEIGIINLEFMPVGTWLILTNLALIFILFFAVILLSLRKKEEFSFRTVFLFVQASVFLVWLAKSQRGVDQFIPFAVLFAAFAFTELKIKLAANARIAAAVILFLFAASCASKGFAMLEYIDQKDFEGCALWLDKNTPKGSNVFIMDYGAFPQLYFYNQNSHFTLGLDPAFMMAYSPEMYSLYEDAIWMRKDPHPIIKYDFNSRYIHIENIPMHSNYIQYLDSSQDKFRLVYSDSTSCRIYAVI